MALTKAQVSLVSVATLGVAAGGYTAQLQAFNTQKEAAAFIATTGLLNAGTNAEFVNTVAGNLNNLASTNQKAAFYKALEDGATRADAAVDFANTVLVEKGSIANVTKATASTSTSMDLGALKAEVTPANAQEVTFNTASGTGFAQKDLQANLGKAEIESGAGKISADFTFNLKNQANVFTDGAGSSTTGGAPGSTVGEFTGAFLSPMLERAAAVQSDSAIYIKLLDGFALRDNFQSIERLATNGVGFSIDGVTIVLADKAEDGNQGAIYKAKNYTELKDALTARLAELAAGNGLPAGADAAVYAKLATFTVELGSSFTKTNQAGDQVTGTELVIKDASGSTLVPQGFSTYGGIHPHTDLNSINELTNQAPSTSTQLISTNIDAENVGYGSQGATLNIAGQSASNKGVEEFKVTATKDVWFTRLESRDLADNQHLQEVLLQTGSNGYFRVGTQKDSKDLVVDLVDQNFGVKGGGLVDVIKLDAAAAGSVAVNAFISDDVIARNYNLKDTDNNYKVEDVNVNYSLTGGNDVLQLAVASEVLAYADTQVNIVAGGGNDLVHLKVVGNDLNTTAGADLGKLTDAGAGTYGKGWLANQQLNDNVKIDAASGDNTIWTEGSGNVRITTGGGNDTIYADNSGRTTVADAGAVAKLKALGMGADVNALYVLNARSANIGDILSNTANKTDGVTNVAQEFKTFKSTVSVSFKGLESKYVEIASTNYVTNTQQINQAIKNAINNDATLNKLIVAKEFPGNVLVIESLIDGKQVLTDLKLDFVSPTATAPVAPATLAPGQLLITAADLTAAAKAYAPAGTATPAAVIDTALNLETAIQATYNLDASGQPAQFATDGGGVAATTTTVATTTAGTQEVQTLDFTGVDATVAGDITVGGVTVTLLGTENAAAIVALVKTAIDAVVPTAMTPAGLGATNMSTTITGNSIAITYPKDAGAITGSIAVAVPGVGGATLTGTLPTATETSNAADEVQTLDFSNVTVAGGETLTFTSDGFAGVLTYTNGVAGDASLTGSALAAAVAADAGVIGDANSSVSASGSVVTVTFDGATKAKTDVSEITVGGTGAGSAGTPGTNVDGADSSAHSDNIINAGAGNDVIALGTGDNSNDTVVLTGTFGKTTIVNFDDATVATEAINGGDLLDFRTYLEANYGATGQANVSVDATMTAGVLANQIKVVNFSDLQAGTTTPTETGGITTAEKLGSVTAAQLTVELNKDFNAAAAATKNVFLIHNDNATNALDNAGEYLVVTATSTDNTTTGVDFTGVTIVGTLDFGAAQTFAGNIVGFDGVIA